MVPGTRWRERWRAFLPQPMRIGAAERWRACLGVFAGLLFALGIGSVLETATSVHAWFVASLGASAILVFVLPSSPLAQPWPVLAGSAVSALIGVACARWLGAVPLAGPLAVMAAMGAMMALRCLHPPGGGIALFAVLSHQTSPAFALAPVLSGAVLLVCAGLLYNNLTGRRYPHRAAAPAAASRFSEADLDAALAHYDHALDISRGDLEALLQRAEISAFQRTLGAWRCADIMSDDPVSVQIQTPLAEAWALMRQHRIKALPVVDGANRVAGIVTVSDFMRQVDLAAHDGLAARLKALVRREDKPRIVGQLMTSEARCAQAQQALLDVIPLFSEGRYRHLPVVAADGALVGIVTQSDLIRALYRALQPAA